MPSYRALAGLDYPPDKRVEVGQVVTDLPSKSIKWLLESGLIEPADKATASLKVVEFDPEAKDGDGDGLVQDNTIHERPIVEPVEEPAVEPEIESEDK